MAEIHKSKISYSQYVDPKYTDFHKIVDNADEITRELLDEVLGEIHAPKGRTKPRLDFKAEDVVFRVMTLEHIPLDPLRKRRPRGCTESHAWTNFPSYKHYIFTDGKKTEVGRSHWDGDFETGNFTVTKGKMTDILVKMFYLLVDRYSTRRNWRYYSYVDEMRANTILHLAKTGLAFNEAKGNNPFAFYTRVMLNCFRSVLKTEKLQQSIKDELLISIGAAPSFAKQAESENGTFSADVYTKAIRSKRKES